VASRKKRPTVRSPTLARGFSVVVEELRLQFKVFGEALGALRDEVAAGFEQVDRRFEQVDHRLGKVEGEVGFLRKELVLVKTVVVEHSGELKEIRGAVARLEQKVDKKVDREQVVAMIERVVAR
jgi:hypothetical protein